MTCYFYTKLAHKSDYDNHINCNSLSLLEFSFEKPDNGINCVNKSKILQECCLALGIFARRVWLMPYPPYDYDNHVVCEIFDSTLHKWIMLDVTSNGYFVDEDKTPLSVVEMRVKFAHNGHCRFIKLDNKVSRYFESHAAEQLYFKKYFAKNLFYFVAEKENCFGDKGTRLVFLPLQFNDMAKSEMNNAFRSNASVKNSSADIRRSRSCDIQCLTNQPI